MLPVEPAMRTLDFSIEETYGYGIINVNALADMYGRVLAQGFAPDVMFLHPLEYKKLNPEGYAEMVRLQEMNDGRNEEDILATLA